jgi:hypothetical protein
LPAGSAKTINMSKQVLKNRHGITVECNFPHGIGPANGQCAKCGAEIKAYVSNYWKDRNSGEMYCDKESCSSWAKNMFLFEHGFHYYTDG